MVVLVGILAFVVAAVGILQLQEMGVDAELTLALAGMGLSIALVAATALLVQESRLLREAQFAPYVSVTGRPWEQGVALFELRIENHGGGSARDIEFELDGDLIMRDGKPLSTLRTLRHGMTYLEPGGVYKTIIGASDFLSTNQRDDPEEDIALRVVTRYRSVSGKRYENVTWIEAREMTRPTPPLKSIDDSLKRIDESLKAVKRVVTHT